MPSTAPPPPMANELLPGQLVQKDHRRDWEEYWAAGGTEHDQQGPAEALRELLEDHRWLLPRGRCLVAGCGRGHDALYLAKRGHNCLGIDFCDAAIANAQKRTKLSHLWEENSARYQGIMHAAQKCAPHMSKKAACSQYNTETLTEISRIGASLFSAIHPSQRQRWAETYARLIVPQGTLIVLLYPLIRRGQSPPYRVTMAECETHLKRYFVLVRVDPNCRCIEGQEGNELLSASGSVPSEEYNQIWHNCWNTMTTKWDKGDVSPALRELIEEKKWELPSGQGIVPGCGRGYDAMFLASPSLHMVGADLSPIAVDTATKLRDAKGIPSDLVEFQTLDFFKFDVPANKYQVAYDYTFFCALHPSMRASWGARYAEIIAPGGHLIALMYPLSKSEEDRNRGPPFLLSEADYHKVLDANFELIHIDPHCKTHDTRVGEEIITVWRRK
ncbi:S-adenosyl-L-methionine-dependent methyltransferase [Coemansia mojavensis]|nr:S-adenosyl-L-methionine-dependent methyltransferase [Coemansia mojavensis]